MSMSIESRNCNGSPESGKFYLWWIVMSVATSLIGHPGVQVGQLPAQSEAISSYRFQTSPGTTPQGPNSFFALPC